MANGHGGARPNAGRLRQEKLSDPKWMICADEDDIETFVARMRAQIAAGPVIVVALWADDVVRRLPRDPTFAETVASSNLRITSKPVDRSRPPLAHPHHQ